MKLSDIHLRDPFVLPLPDEQRYYLYGTMGAFTWTDSALGIDGYTSTDLQNWDGPFPAFRPQKDFWADRNFWAPEVHIYRGRYYLFASFKAEEVCRGTQILVADVPQGPFHPISAGPVTPDTWECLDGTLFVDDEQPWMVFCHEWVQVGDGQICALPLSKDLTEAVGHPRILFRASEAPWALEIDSKGRKGYVTDGPWMHRLPNGCLLMLWSSFSTSGYTIGVARSTSGTILGPWQQDPVPLYASNGGHCMVFRDFNGQLWLSLHQPNQSPDERSHFIKLKQTETSLEIG